MADDEWGEGSTETTCDHCGQMRPCLHVDDPFMAEIHDEYKPSWWCRPCFSDRKDDI